MNIFGSILSESLVVRRTTRPQFLVVLTYFLVAEDERTLEFCYPGHAEGGGGAAQTIRGSFYAVT